MEFMLMFLHQVHVQLLALLESGRDEGKRLPRRWGSGCQGAGLGHGCELLYGWLCRVMDSFGELALSFPEWGVS